MNYIGKLEKLEEQFWARVSNLGVKYRKDVVLPLCKEHNVCFISGMGRFFFYENDEAQKEIDEDHPLWNETMKVLIGILDREITHNQFFGYFIDDVTSEDIK
jgi:hypothetical protein